MMPATRRANVAESWKFKRLLLNRLPVALPVLGLIWWSLAAEGWESTAGVGYGRACYVTIQMVLDVFILSYFVGQQLFIITKTADWGLHRKFPTNVALPVSLITCSYY